MPPEAPVRDRPAERGITVSNILLSVIGALGTIFGTMVLGDMSDLKQISQSMNEKITEIRVSNGEHSKDIQHLNEHVDKMDKRLTAVEAKVK